jgi:HAE1 family hydrophobic/amphiphilic exporter-1
MASDNIYLQKLKFKPEYLNTFIAKYLKNVRLMIVLILAIIIGGIYSFININRTLNPEIDIPLILVSTTLPGAGPEDIEDLVTIPLENQIKNVKGLSTYQSVSQDSVSIISIEFTSQTELNQAREQVQAAVNKANDLPDDANTPQVQELDFENFPIINFGLSQPDNPEDLASLYNLSEKLKDELEQLGDVDRVETNGLPEREIQIFISPEKMAEKNLNPFQLFEAIRNSLQTYPAGQVTAQAINFSFTIDQPITSIEQLRELKINVQGTTYSLKDLGLIVEKDKTNQANSYLADTDSSSHPTVTFAVYKTTTAQLDESGREVKQRIDQFLKDYPQFETKMIIDYPTQIDDQFADLNSNFLQTLGLVFLSMLLVYGARQAIIGAVAIPLAMLIVFVAMNILDLSLSFISIFSLLIALGLFVDNAVVIIEAYTSYYRSGKFSPLQTAILVWQDYWLELFSINLLTVWAFLPLLISTGIIGEFIYPIPIIVSVAMMGSAGVALLVTLPSMRILSEFNLPKRVKYLLIGLSFLTINGLAVYLLPKNLLLIPIMITFLWLQIFIAKSYKQIAKRFKEICPECFYNQIIDGWERSFKQGFINLDYLSNVYRKIITLVVNSKRLRLQVLITIIVFTVFSYLLIPIGLVENEFFPKTNEERVYVELELPAGTKQEITEAEMLDLIEQLEDRQSIDYLIGEVQKRTSMGFSFSPAEENNAEITLSLKPENQREITSFDLAQEIRNQLDDYTTGNIQVMEETSGPPAGADLQLNLLGPDLNQLEDYANQVENFLASTPGVTNIDRSIKKGPSKLSFKPDQNKLSQYGVRYSDLGFWLRAYISGSQIDQIKIDNNDYDISLKMEQNEITPSQVEALSIPTQRGYIPIREFGNIVLQPNPTLITREDGERTISVTASTLPGYQAPELNEKLQNFARNELSLADNYQWNIGGVNEENQQSVESILQAMIVSAVLILATMVIQLGSFRRAFLVIIVIPLAASGVFTLFALTGTPLSLPSLIGVLALFGIVIANSLMIVDKVTKNTDIGIPTKEAIIDASASRLEPIFLTTVSQIIGLIPITLSDPLWRGMGGAIIAGMSFSGIIMLFFIPVVYYYLFRESKENKQDLNMYHN